MLQLRNAYADETATLTELCLRSKAVWGYDAAFMAACRDELTIRPGDLDRSLLQVAVANDAVIGLAQVTVDGDDADLRKAVHRSRRIADRRRTHPVRLGGP